MSKLVRTKIIATEIITHILSVFSEKIDCYYVAFCCLTVWSHLSSVRMLFQQWLFACGIIRRSLLKELKFLRVGLHFKKLFC